MRSCLVIDFDSDPDHCGTCGNACLDGEICLDGACQCPPGYIVCDCECRLPNECGGCEVIPGASSIGTPCGDDACQTGRIACVGTDEVECAAETSRDNDPLACGDGCNACNVAIGEICLDGECRCAPGQAEIDGTCGEIQPGTVLTGDPSAGPGGTVRFSGEVTSLGNPVPWQHGVCLGPDAMNLDDCADLGVRDTLGVFTTSGMAVTPGTPFVYAAYIQNGDIRVWGEPRNFLWPTISTQSPTVTGAFSATLRGVVNDLGSPAATARGFCYGTASGPEPGNTPGGGCATSGGAITSGVPYTSDVAGLSEGTPYYVRAWVESIGGRIYGDERSFVTFTRSTVVMPPAAGVAVDQIGTTSARFNAAVATIGNPLSTVPGFCYAVHPATPELGPECVSLPARTTPGNFSSTVSGLVPGTRYNVRAFVTNGAGTNWSAIHDFTALQLPEVSLANVQPALGSVSANVVVNVLGVPSPTEHGLCVATSEAGLASACNSRGPAGSATSFGPYGEPTPSGGTTYYIQAYATNAAGTAYSAVQSFTAWQLPSVATFAETDVQPSSFRAHGRVLGTGVPGTITARGFCVGTSNTPRPGNTPGAGGGCPTNSVSVSGSDFNRVMSGLAPYTTYYVAAFAENAAGRGYGSDVMVTTAPQLPVVATLSPTSVGFEGATLRGRVTTLGNPDPVDARFRWRIQGSGTSNILNFSGGGPSGTNIFSQALGGLAWDTTYEYRSEVYHEAYGWVAGSYVSFTTQDFPAVLVRPTGTNNSNCGRNPSATPCQTVAYAYNTQAANLGRNEVWLIGNSSTTFNETERIDLVAGRHLRGGYSISGGEVTGGGSAPRILSTHWNAVRAVNLASITHIQNVRIQTTNRGNASSAGSAGPSTFVLIVSGGSNRVRLTDVRLIAGRGGNGAAGNTPTQSGCSGANGSAGNSGDDSGTGGNGANGSSGSGCTTASGTFSGGRGGGGSNGNNSGNTGFCGGRPAGGSATCTGGNGGSGGSGRRACSGQAGSGSVGGAGAAGSSGASGGGGAGVGTVNTDNLNAPYSAAGGVAGQPGVSGRGGGGGGGGGGRRCLTTNRRGGGGGGGGNGGYGGLGGGGGGGGGASVAALVINATLHTEAGGNVFQTVGGGSGGSGGSASAGGSGGAGGNGGNGELSSWPFGNEVGGTGGRGGNGGSGGNGGCGGGGGGGPSIGVWHVGSGSGVSGSGRSFQIGGGGSGGNRGTGNCSGNPSSNNGSPGLQAEVY